MGFHEYRLSRNCNAPSEMDISHVDKFYTHADLQIRSGLTPLDQAILLSCELGYVRCQRPCYHVYPAVVKCLANTKLHFELKSYCRIERSLRDVLCRRRRTVAWRWKSGIHARRIGLTTKGWEEWD